MGCWSYEITAPKPLFDMSHCTIKDLKNLGKANKWVVVSAFLLF